MNDEDYSLEAWAEAEDDRECVAGFHGGEEEDIEGYSDVFNPRRRSATLTSHLGDEYLTTFDLGAHFNLGRADYLGGLVSPEAMETGCGTQAWASRPGEHDAYGHYEEHEENPSSEEHPNYQESRNEAREFSYRPIISQKDDQLNDTRFRASPYVQDVQRSIKISTLESFPELRANRLGELDHGLQYVCEGFRQRVSDSEKLYLPVDLCAYYLGYDDAFSMAVDKDLTIASMRSEQLMETFANYGRGDGVQAVSALSMFQAFGRLIIREPGEPALVETRDFLSRCDRQLADRSRRRRGTAKCKRPAFDTIDNDFWEQRLADADAGEEEFGAYLDKLEHLRKSLCLTHHFKALIDILNLVPKKILEQVTHDLRGQYPATNLGRWLRSRAAFDRVVRTEKFLICQWELPTVFANIFLDKGEQSVREMLAQHLVVTGSNGVHKCTSCLEIARSCWGSAGKPDIQGSVQVHGGRERSVWNVSYFATPSVLAVTFFTPQDVTQLFDAICWICSAVRNTDKEARPKDSGGLLLSRAVRYRTTRSNPARSWLTTYDFYKLHPLEELEIEGSSSSMCWTKLFKSVPVVESSIDRAWGRGLEIPFPLMMALSAVENVCTLDGRTALLGFHTALIPTQRAALGNLVQWHFLDIDPGEGPLLPTHVSGFVESGWLKLDTETMKSMTCFLGWASHANIMLGTEELVEREAKMRSCRTLDLGKAHWEKEQAQAAFQVSVGVTVADLIGQAGRTWKWTLDTIERTPSSEYQQALNETRRKTCLLIDSQSKQAWLVPLLSVLFHLCHRYHQINTRFPSEEQTPLPYIRPTADGEDAVFDAIGHQHDLKVGNVRLRALFHTLYLNLIQYPRLNCAEYVYANDLMDVVENTRTYPRKVPLNGNGYCWPDLLPFAEAAHAVAVCANIGQVLQVQQSLGGPICQCTGSLLCYQLPQGRSYFAAHVASLNRLCDNDSECQDVVYSGCEPPPRYRIFGTGASWAPQTDPWRSVHCRGTPVWAKKATANRVLQETSPDSLRKKLWNRQLNVQAFASSKGASFRRGPPTPPLLGGIPENGVVVFGRYKDH